MVRLGLVWIAVAFSIAACAYLNESTHRPTEWEMACEDVSTLLQEGTCEDYAEPEIVWGSHLITSFGAMGVFVQPEWRVYMAPLEFTLMFGFNYEHVLYHEEVHAVLSKHGEWTRCQSEELARRLTDARFGLKTNEGWKEFYGCTNAPSP